MKKFLLITLGLSVLVLSSCQNQNLIGKDKAKEIALNHANLTAEQVNFITAETDRDNGKTVYEIEFYTDDFSEYDYEIDATSGDILSFDADAEGTVQKTESQPAAGTEQNPQSQPDSVGITEDEIKSKVLEKVPGATEENIRQFRKEFDNGIDMYEGKIIFENKEYEFEINAKTGEIISWESESVFD